MKDVTLKKVEARTARLTILIDPRKKSVFEHLCARQDLTPSQVVRRLIRDYIEQHLGRPWAPDEEDAAGAGRPAGKHRPRRP